MGCIWGLEKGRFGERGWEDWDCRVVRESRDTGQIYDSLLELLA